jgi:electron transport complex protein RnfG
MKIKMVLSLLIVCLAAAGLLSWVYTVTTPIIEAGMKAKLDEQLRQVFPSACGFDLLVIEGDTLLKDTLWIAVDSATNRVGIVFKVYPMGYGGPIETLVGLANDTSVVAIRPATPSEGLKETPGLGVRVTEPWFIQQFEGKKMKDVQLKKDGGTIDAITAATISSSAVTDGVREGIKRYAKWLPDKEKIERR